MRRISADWVVLGDKPPIRDGVVSITTNGTIASIGTGEADTHVRGVIMPGLVNAHTHLELSALRGRVPGRDGFIAWVEKLIGARVELAEDEERDAIRAAVRELRDAGTALVGEVTNSLAAVSALAEANIAGCIFHEVFGQDLARLRERVSGLEAELKERVPVWPSEDLAYAPAPHTLYTLHLDVAKMILEECRRLNRRTSLHLLEHALERRAIERGEGPVVEWLATRSRVDPSELAWPKKPVIDVADDIGALAPDVLLVHLTEARPDELARIAAAKSPVVLCPRSNLHIEGKLPPLLAVREAGIEPALGTDSLASNASLDVLAEAKALADRFPTIPAWELLKLSTWNGARALGRADLGRIAEGSTPSLVAIDGDLPREGDPCAWILGNLKAPRRFVS
ncbi:MAG TPA: amidohydrolase family protein [Polyangiaceae bacterium]|jgi:cytosine/adenosine deaminase-related metal-dependent hydrolase|nr:amidohydrolase family protein [Polyangiaceae bacterium]